MVDEALPAGLLNARYEIREKIGEGATSIIYRAYDHRMERPVAIKFLDPKLLKNKENIERFQREALLISGLRHGNICDVSDRGIYDNTSPFLVMEYLEGQDLESLIKEKRRLSPTRAGGIISQVLSALAFIHSQGIIHRDLKPANIFTIHSGDKNYRIKLLDFGISKSIDEHPGTSLTPTGTILGTPLYMSPEQALKGNQNLDARADIWSAGVAFYECITGKTPFSGNNHNEVVFSIINDEPKPPSSLVPILHVSVDRIIQKALNKELSNRFQTAREFQAEIHKLLADTKKSQITSKTTQISSSDRQKTPSKGLTHRHTYLNRKQWHVILGILFFIIVCNALFLYLYSTQNAVRNTSRNQNLSLQTAPSKTRSGQVPGEKVRHHSGDLIPFRLQLINIPENADIFFNKKTVKNSAITGKRGQKGLLLVKKGQNKLLEITITLDGQESLDISQKISEIEQQHKNPLKNTQKQMATHKVTTRSVGKRKSIQPTPSKSAAQRRFVHGKEGTKIDTRYPE